MNGDLYLMNVKALTSLKIEHVLVYTDPQMLQRSHFSFVNWIITLDTDIKVLTLKVLNS